MRGLEISMLVHNAWIVTSVKNAVDLKYLILPALSISRFLIEYKDRQVQTEVTRGISWRDNRTLKVPENRGLRIIFGNPKY